MNIGLLISDYNSSEYSYNICKYVKEQCNKYNIGLFIYEGRRFLANEPTNRQHNIVYNLISKNTLDGIISITPGICGENAIDEYRKFITNLEVPVVSVGLDLPGCPSIISNNEIGMIQLMEHLILNCTDKQKYAFLCGPKDNVEAKLRLRIFKKTLQKYNIKYSEENIYSGDFTPVSGYKAAKKMITKIQDGMIDTIVCANDEMAFAVIKCLNDNGIVIPRDVIVTGYDDFKHSNGIKITTVRQPLEEMAECSVNIIKEMVLNKVCSTNRIISFDSQYVIRDIQNKLEFQAHINMNFFQDYFERIQTFKTLDLYSKLSDLLKENGVTDFFIVKYKESTNKIYTIDDIAEKSQIVFGISNSKNITYTEEFNTKDVLPKEILKTIKKKQFLIKPLFFEYEHFGFFVSRSNDYDVQLLEHLCPAISNAIMGSKLLEKQKLLMNNLSEDYKKIVATELKLNETIQQLNAANDELHDVAEKDELTGVYSRYGLTNKVNEAIKSGQQNPFYLVYCDMDGLKQINDTYGHDDGDYAIKEMANILQTSVRVDSSDRKPDIVARMGGDEFVVFIQDALDDISIIESRFVDNLQKCNDKLSRLNKPWKISFSWGCLKGNSINNYLEILRQADTLMYERKKKKKALNKPLN